jgi:predicted Zn-dependent peptidase
VIYAEIEKLKQQLATDRELEKTKNIVESYYIRVLKTNQYKAVFLGVHHTVQKDYRVMFSEVEHYRAVKAADIQQAAKQYLTQNNRIVVIARPGAE